MLDYETTMSIGEAAYQDVIDLLGTAGLPASFTQTGGMCAALEIRLETGHTLLVTDEDDTLSWHRADHEGWRLGLFPPNDEYVEEPLAYGSTPDGSPQALAPLVARVVRAYTFASREGARGYER